MDGTDSGGGDSPLRCGVFPDSCSLASEARRDAPTAPLMPSSSQRRSRLSPLVLALALTANLPLPTTFTLAHTPRLKTAHRPGCHQLRFLVAHERALRDGGGTVAGRARHAPFEIPLVALFMLRLSILAAGSNSECLARRVAPISSSMRGVLRVRLKIDLAVSGTDTTL